MLMFDHLALWMYDHPAGVIGGVAFLAAAFMACVVGLLRLLDE